MARFILLGVLALILATPRAVTAQEGSVAALLECRQISDPERRLACFDNLADEYSPEVGKAPEPGAPEASEHEGVDEPVAEESVAADDGEPSAGMQAPDAAGAEPESSVDSGDRDSAPAPARQERVGSADELALPHRGRIEAFSSNSRGDYRFRISAGIVFERAGGPGVPSSDLTGAEFTLSKNFLGQWRARVEGQPRELWVRPVRR